MELAVYYLETDPDEQATGLMNGVLHHFPEHIQNSITRYRNLSDRLLTFAGKLLLLKALKDLSLNRVLSLDDLQYTSLRRPFFNYPVDFNISHSGQCTILAVTTQGKTGVDVEMIRPADIEIFREIFSEREWEMVREDPDNDRFFYNIWTRKEAVVKASGRGLHIPLCLVDVLDECACIDHEQFWTREIQVGHDYTANIATSFRVCGSCIPEKVTFRDCIREYIY